MFWQSERIHSVTALTVVDLCLPEASRLRLCFGTLVDDVDHVDLKAIYLGRISRLGIGYGSGHRGSVQSGYI